jgi:hypothetical protein
MQIVDKIVPSKFVLFLVDFRSFNIVRVFDATRPQLDRAFPFIRLRIDPTLCNVPCVLVPVVCCSLYPGVA